MPDEVVKEVRRTERPLDEWKKRVGSPAEPLVADVPQEELKRMLEQAARPIVEEEGGAITLATPEESKVIVEDLAQRYDIPPGFILAFKDRKTGKITPYFTKNFYGVILERKGYARLAVETTGPKHDPANHRYHYIAELTPVIPDKALEALRLLKDVDREAFLKEYRRLMDPIHEEGYASMDTVRMRTMKTDYNLERLARTRAYRHMAVLYCGVGGGMSREVEEQAEEVEELGPVQQPQQPEKPPIRKVVP